LDHTKSYIEKIHSAEAQLAGHAHKLDVKLQGWCGSGLKKNDRTWLCVSVTLAPKAVESCSKAQKTWQVFQSALEKKFFTWGMRIFFE